MDIVEFLKSLFCCMFPMLRKPSKKTTSKSSVPAIPLPPKTVESLRREKLRRLWSLETSYSYEQKQGMILGRIAFEYENMVVVWCGRDYIPHKLKVRNFLKSLGDVSFIRDRWHESESNFGGLWRGALVQYDRKMQATRASFNIPIQMVCLRATMLGTVISHLVNCELLHPLCHRIPSKVFISKRIPLQVQGISDLYDCLCTYGAMESFVVNDRTPILGPIYEVTYAYLTQAYLAMIMTDGQYFKGGILTATLKTTKKGSEILRDAKECMSLLSHCGFPK